MAWDSPFLIMKMVGENEKQERERKDERERERESIPNDLSLREREVYICLSHKLILGPK